MLQQFPEQQKPAQQLFEVQTELVAHAELAASFETQVFVLQYL